ncbi:dymeclin-like [Gigantopelta aegis]|uniref:dymeclin-like n=1 Tax=Gigantopelta aegis TaxID=1735272 RepID=UPI001B88B0F2|nr:dymeclin-like [Gigantopelta aegis]
MGATSSSLSELASNDYLKRLSGTEPINPMDPYWNQLLSFSFLIPVNSTDARLLEESTAAVCRNFSVNNTHTGNFRSLIHNFLVRSAELKASAQCDDNIFIWQTYNALFIIRSLCKYFVEYLSEELLLQQFDCKPPDPDGSVPELAEGEQMGSLAEDLLNSLIELIVDVPVLNFTYALHLEALNTILTLLSIQMFQPQATSTFTIFRFMMQGKCAIHAPLLMKALLWNYINQEKIPPELYKGTSESSSMLYDMTAAVASSFWSVVTLGMGSKPKPVEEDFSDTLLANQSLLLILVLTNHCTSDRGFNNPYRQALFSFTDSQDTSNPGPTRAVPTFKIDFNRLYTTLCLTLKDDQNTLLFYLLLHQNMHMKAFILSRTNVDQIVLPLLRILYEAQERNSHHIYMALIILLILSEDDVFNKAVHQIVIKSVPWFKERPLSEITLGGLLILVVIRTIQFNMARMRDKYLHTNCLAALANMSAQFSDLHPFVAQKIISLFAQLCKKHVRLVEQIRQSATNSDRGTESEDDMDHDYLADLNVLEEVIRMVLEIINSTLTTSLQHNPNLIYTLLYKRDLFTQFRTHPTFQDIIQNIDTILAFFTARLEQNGKNISPSEVLEIINEGAIQFRKDRLKKFPELKFKYVEEDSPEEFFIPYVWSLVYHVSNMYFNATRIVLFSLSTTDT